MSDQLVPLGTFSNILEARMALNLLESAGIPALLEGEETGAVLAGLQFLGHKVRVLVAAEHALRASSLIADSQDSQLSDDWEDDAERVAVCSLCGGALGETDPVCPDCRTPRDSLVDRFPPRKPTDDHFTQSE